MPTNIYEIFIKNIEKLNNIHFVIYLEIINRFF